MFDEEGGGEVAAEVFVVVVAGDGPLTGDVPLTGVAPIELDAGTASGCQVTI